MIKVLYGILSGGIIWPISDLEFSAPLEGGLLEIIHTYYSGNKTEVWSFNIASSQLTSVFTNFVIAVKVYIEKPIEIA